MGSITIAMVVVMLLSIMLVVVKGFASKEATKASIKEIIEDLTPNQILDEYKRQLTTLKVCALGGGLLTLMYAMQFFSGGEINPLTWAFGQWFAVAVGGVVVFAITATQYNLYQDVSGAKTAVFIIIGILVFVFISEIASTAERESQLVKTRSSQSPAMQVALSAVNSNTSSLQGATGYESLLANAQAKKAEHEIELKRCKRHANKGAKRVEHCRNYENKKIAHYQAMVNQYSQSANQRHSTLANATTALIDKVQVLQQDENQHASIIKFFKQFGITATSAMMFVAFILVNAFELGFHYSGSRVGHLKSALAQIGYDLQSNTNSFEIQKSKMDLLKLRDARQTKEEMERLKEEIRALSGKAKASPSPATAQPKQKPDLNHQGYGFNNKGAYWGAGVGLGLDVPLGETGLSLTPAIGTGFIKPFKSETKTPLNTENHQPQTMGFIDTNNRPTPSKKSAKKSTMERQKSMINDDGMVSIEKPLKSTSTRMINDNKVSVYKHACNNTDKNHALNKKLNSHPKSKKIRFDTSTNAKKGDEVHCPECGNPFTKKTYNHVFCKPKCRFDYHNEADDSGKRIEIKEAVQRKRKRRAKA